MAENLNKAALVERVFEYDNFETKKQAKEFVDDFFAMITGTVIAGGTVSIAGFGKFESRISAPKSGVTKGTSWSKEETVVPKFVAFSAFKDAVAAAK